MRPISVDRSVFAVFLSLALILLLPGLGSAQENGSDQSLLFFSNWNASAYSNHAGGTVCWLAGDDGSLRVEVGRGPARFVAPGSSDIEPVPNALQILLDRTGVGWTLVLGPDDSGTFNAWGEEWRQPPEGLAPLVRLVTMAVGTYPETRPDFAFATRYPDKEQVGHIPRPAVLSVSGVDSGPVRAWRYQMNMLLSENGAAHKERGFRGRMTARGRGSGGEDEVVTLAWDKVEDQSGSGVKVHSSRRPGTLDLARIRSQQVTTPAAEVFLPLWPMSRFF